jgi:hypothetical protein
MTIETLLNYPTDDIAKMSDEQLKAALVAYFPLTRPTSTMPSISAEMQFAPNTQALLDALKAEKAKTIVKLT